MTKERSFIEKKITTCFLFKVVDFVMCLCLDGQCLCVGVCDKYISIDPFDDLVFSPFFCSVVPFDHRSVLYCPLWSIDHYIIVSKGTYNWCEKNE